MTYKSSIHPRAKARGFLEIFYKNMGNNLFQFHLNQLIKLELVEKNENLYRLTKDGKKLSLRIDFENAKIEKQAKIGVALGCIRKLKGKEQI